MRAAKMPLMSSRRVGIAIPTSADLQRLFAGVPGILWDTTAKQNLFKTNDTSTPVGQVADAVGLNADLLSGWSLAQSNGSLRPSYREPDGFGSILFDGSNDCLGFAAGGGLGIFNAIAYGTIILAAKPTSTAAAGRMIHIATNTVATSRVSLDKNASNNFLLNGRRLDGDTNRTLVSAATVAGAWAIFSAEFDFANGVMLQRVNLNAPESSNPAWGAGTATSNTNSHSVVMGASRLDNGSTPFSGYIGPGLILPVQLSADEYSAAVRCFAGLTRIIL